MNRISVIIPSRNRAHLLPGAIDSILTQSRPCQEIIVVDDGSEDDTATVVHSRYPSVKLVCSHGVGPGPARNIGVAASSGDIIMFLDSDDRWLANHAATLETLFRQHFFVGYGVTTTIHGDESFYIPAERKGPQGFCRDFLENWCFLVPSAMAVSRDLFDQIGGFADIGIGEDWDFFLRLADQVPFGFAGSEPITLRYLHEDSLCVNLSGQVLENALQKLAYLQPHSGRFQSLLSWTKANKEKFSSIQQWYCSMRQAGIVRSTTETEDRTVVQYPGSTRQALRVEGKKMFTDTEKE